MKDFDNIIIELWNNNVMQNLNNFGCTFKLSSEDEILEVLIQIKSKATGADSLNIDMI